MVLNRSDEENKQTQPTPATMCYTTITDFRRCSHRTSTITHCPRSTQHRPTIYHPPIHHSRPCGTNGREGSIFVQREGLCEACRRIISWYVGGGVGLGIGRKAESRRKSDKVPRAAQMAGSAPHHHHHAAQGRAAAPDAAHSMYPIPTEREADGRCPLSEVFERVLSIGGDEDARVDGSPGVSGAVGEGGPGADGSRTRRERGVHGPLTPPRFYDVGNGGHGSSPLGGMPSWSGGYGGHAGRRARRTAGKKQVRFAPKVEVLYFRGDWATRTLRSLSREYKRHR